MVIRKCLGTSKDSCFCGTSDDLSLCANWEWGGAKPGEGQPGHAQLTSASLSSCAVSLLNFLKQLCLLQFLPALCVSRSFLPGSVSFFAPQSLQPLVRLLFNLLASPALLSPLTQLSPALHSTRSPTAFSLQAVCLMGVMFAGRLSFAVQCTVFTEG